MVNTITLISITGYTTDTIGQITTTEDRLDVIAEVSSISQSEFMDAGQIGLKPSLRFEIWTAEYSGQENVEMDGTRYSVYRTFNRIDGRTELYTERRSGDE